MSTTPSDAFRFRHRLRVRWAEVDMQHIVFNAHYLMYLDTAVGDYWRALALPYQATMAGLGGDLYVKKSTLEYHASARYDDALDVGIRCAHIGNSSMRFEGLVSRGGEPLVSGEIVYVYADPRTQTSQPVPTALRDVLTGYEAGGAMTTLTAGDWATLQPAVAPLRREVFVAEQHVPETLEWDADDATALHLACTNRLGATVATGRLLPAQGGVARIGRMAVRRELRGGGLGRAVLLDLMARSQARGDRAVVLHAQRAAEPFYAAAGFVAEGPTFDEAGIPHVAMRRVLGA